MRSLPSFFLLALTVFSIRAETVSDEVKPLLDKAVDAISALSTDPVVVAAVKNYNIAPTSTMTNDSWKKLTLLSPEVKALIKSDIGQYLKTKKSSAITEMFLNGADGGKVAFLSKTTSWSHKGKAKHDDPMANKKWIGEVEVDESSGSQQVQVGIPILDGATPIGSLVIGFGISQLKENAAK